MENLKTSDNWWIVSENKTRVIAISKLGAGVFTAPNRLELASISQHSPTQEAKDEPKSLHIAIGGGCAEKCGYCYHGAKAHGLTAENKPGFENLVRKLEEENPRTITFAGNEPLAEWPLLEKAIENFSTKQQRRIVLSNGLRLDQEKIAKLKFEDVELGLSLDHLVIYGRLSETLSLIQNAGLDCNLALTLSASNLQYFKKRFGEIVETIALLGFKSLSINLDFISPQAFKENHVPELILAIKQLLLDGFERDVFVKGDWDKILASVCNAKPSRFCQAAYSTYYINDSNVSTCPLIEKQVQLSHQELLQNDSTFQKPFEKTEQLRQKILSEWCTGCPIINYCGGGCLGTVEKKAWCDFMRGMIVQIVSDPELSRNYLES